MRSAKTLPGSNGATCCWPLGTASRLAGWGDGRRRRVRRRDVTASAARVACRLTVVPSTIGLRERVDERRVHLDDEGVLSVAELDLDGLCIDGDGDNCDELLR